MALTREERKLLHHKSQQPTFGSGKPDSREGSDGDISFRKVEGSGTVQYLKENNDWTAISSTGEMPAVRIGGGSSGGGSSGVSNHASLSGLESDDHEIYLLIDGTRDMTGDLTMSDGNGINLQEDITFTGATVENKIKFPDNLANALLIGEGTNIYLQFKSSNSSEKIQFHVDADIDGGTIDGTTIGASSHTTIKGTTIDATTDFTIDGLVITADTITNDAALTVDAAGDIILDANSGVTKFYLAGDTDDLCTLTVAANGATTIATTDSSGITGHLTLDADGDIILDAAGDDIYFKDAGSERFRMDLNSTPTLAVTGAFTIDGSATVTIDGTTGVNIQEGGTNVINIDTDKYIYFHAYAQSLAEDYALNNKAVLYHFTTGNADYKENYTFLSYYHVPDNSGTDLYEAYPS